MSGCRAKLRRAEHHLEALTAEITAFEQNHAARVTVKRDAQQQAYLFHAWDVAEPDPEWGLLIGDCAHNARSALDHLAYQLAILHLGRDLDEGEARRIHFPLVRDASSFRDSRRKLRGLLRPSDLERIEQLQPYTGA